MILSVDHVSKKFGNLLALDDVSFSVDAGQFVVIGGSNGSGKSVLMSLIADLDKPSKGNIVLEKGTKAGLVFQDADAQILGETPYEDVAFGAKNCGLKKEELAVCVNQALESVGLAEKKDITARTMSGGEKRRLAVAGIVAMKRELIIFDEPFANLDWPGVKNVCAILKQLKEEGKTVIVLTHELEKILGLADRFLVLDKGKIRFDGSVTEGLSQDLSQWSIRNPLSGEITSARVKELLWL